MKRIMLVAGLLAGCGSQLKVEPVKVQPIHITVDVNVHDKADKAVGDEKPAP